MTFQNNFLKSLLACCRVSVSSVTVTVPVSYFFAPPCLTHIFIRLDQVFYPLVGYMDI